MAYEIVAYAQEHEAAVAELERILWNGDTATNVAHLRWKYRATPLFEHCFLFVALDAGRVVGVRGLVGGRWQARRDQSEEPVEFTLLSGADLVIAPEHRGSGLYRQLTEAALERVDSATYALALTFSASPANRLASLASGWRQAFTIERCVRDASPGWRRRLAGVLGLGRDAVEHFERLGERRRDTRVGRVSMQHRPRAADMAQLVARVPWDGRIRQVRDEAFFAWRFDGPLAVNRFLYCDDGGLLRGYLVIQAKRQRPGLVVVIDFEADDAEVLTELVEAACVWASDARIELWTAGMRAAAGDVLDRSGFRAREAARGVGSGGPALLVRTLDGSAADSLQSRSGRRIAEHGDWDLRPVYSDAY
jgi:GNAT superfamily N-acetyltransferase